MQPPQFSPDEAARLRERGLTLVAEQVDPGWMNQAIDALWLTARREAWFIVDNVWANGQLASTRENRAMGTVMRFGLSHGWIEATDQYRPSDRTTSHRNPRRVWHSLVYARPEEAIAHLKVT